MRRDDERASGNPDRARALAQYAEAAPGYDRHMRRLARIQRAAIARLDVPVGGVVVDVACGTGLTFEGLLTRVGAGGRVVGIELSPDMLARARERVERRGWENVVLIEAAVEEARLEVPADAALFSFTHDVLQSPAAVTNVVSLLRPGAGVAACGGKLAGRWQPLTNAVVRRMARPYMTTLRGLDRPWRELERHTDGMESRAYALGGAYVAWGRIVNAT